MLYNIIILNSITKCNKPVELVWCEVILDKKKAREILYKAHWTELLVSPWKNYYAELIIINDF